MRNHQNTFQWIFSAKKIALLLFASISLTFFILQGCNRNENPETKQGQPVEYSENIAKIVSQVPAGTVSPTEPLLVQFTEPIARKGQVGTVLQKSVFHFEPSLSGVTRWKDRKTLSFTPNKSLPLRQHYEGLLNLSLLVPTQQPVKPIHFRFDVAGRELENVSADFKLVNHNDPTRLRYEGNISFTEPVDSEKVKEATSLQLQNKTVELTWKSSDNGKTFQFESPVFIRDSETKHLTLTVAHTPVDISRNYKKQILLPAMETLKITEISRLESGDKPRFKVKFSDELDPTQSIAGLVTVDDKPEPSLNISGNSILVEDDFEFGRKYMVHVHPGIRSRWGTTLKKAHTREVDFDDLKPELRFANDGAFLPTSNEQEIRFTTLNLRRVHLNIIKVFESNLGQFLQTQDLDSKRQRSQQFRYENRVGVSVADTELVIGNERNQWLQNSLDLRSILKQAPKGLFLLSLNFKHDDMIYGDIGDEEENNSRHRYYISDYYNDPYSNGYVYRHGRVYKPVILSDIGLTHFAGDGTHIVYATDLVSSEPVGDVKVSLRTYQNQVIATGKTDDTGKATFQNISEDVFYIEGEKGEQRSVVKSNSMGWNLSTFDTGGEKATASGLRAFLYTERGVYRPGDEINLAAIIRNEEGTFPDHHPVTLKVYNPKNQKVLEETHRDGIDGFYRFTIQTKVQDLTGDWCAELKAGGSTFNHTLKIETVAPYRLKVEIKPSKRRLDWTDNSLHLNLHSEYLFGMPASKLQAEVTVTLQNRTKNVPKYSGFVFENQAVKYQSSTNKIFTGKLDDQGNTSIDWELPPMKNVPSELDALVNAKVYEKGGRPNQSWKHIPVEPYQYYVGIRPPKTKWGYIRLNEVTPLSVVLVDTSGNEVAGEQMHYRIYQNNRYWWWEYDSREAFHLRFKSDSQTQLVEQGTLISQKIPVTLNFDPKDRGQYLIEVQYGNEGHTAAIFTRAYPWGSVPPGEENAGTLSLSADQQKYHPGDVATVTFPVPLKGRALVGVESGEKVLSTKWYVPDGKQNEMQVNIPVTDAMVPTAYVSVSVIQPHAQTVNDRPIRMYGVVPLKVENKETRQPIQIQMPDELKSNEPFTVKVRTEDGKPTQFTVAVVDEGLLALTQFRTPDPWSDFFRKIRLGVNISDLFSDVIGANKGDIFRTFSIGGGISPTYRESQLSPTKAKRFKPVSMFKGPLKTDERGEAEVQFTLPDYIGAVRVMVVNASNNRYGHAEKTVPVKTDLMVEPSLPRVLGPDDNFVVPVTVFAMQDDIKDVQVTIKTNNLIDVVGDSTKSMHFSKTGQHDVQFNLHTKEIMGVAIITIRASSGNYSVEKPTNIAVRPTSPRIYTSTTNTVKAGESTTIKIPGQGVTGSNHASLTINRGPKIELGRRINWLIHYPYGCIEQTVSSVFPQLYLKKFLTGIIGAEAAEKDIDKYINAGIKRLYKFQLVSGAFSYWPGGHEPSAFASVYGGHFLVEAKHRGYHVPDDLYNNWLRYMESQALVTKDNLMIRVYRVYLLALAGDAQLGAMNLLRENNLKDMNNPERWLLATAYQLAGAKRFADTILEHTGLTVPTYAYYGITYGSSLRDKAIILDAAVQLGRFDVADQLAKEIASALSQDHWYSTQTVGYSLLAEGKYLDYLEGGDNKHSKLEGTVTLASGEMRKFDTESLMHSMPIDHGFGKEIEVYLDPKSNLRQALVTLDWNGIPAHPDLPDLSKNLILQVEWYDEDGMELDISKLKQGTTFWGHFYVERKNHNSQLNEVALVQVLPAGWEIENTRLTKEDEPNWMRYWNLNTEDYTDIRDDRVMWFFDIKSRWYYRRQQNSKRFGPDFIVKLNAVTVGEFTLPPTIVEAMYDNNYKARKAGRTVQVVPR